MKSATISQAKNHLSELLAGVKRGESVLILERNRPIARIVPIDASQQSDDERLADLERRGVIRRPARPPRKALPPPIRLSKKVSVLEALLQEREEGR